MRGVPPLLEPLEGPFTTADILVAVKATVHGTYYNKPVAQATIPPERADDFLQDEGRMFTPALLKTPSPQVPDP